MRKFLSLVLLTFLLSMGSVALAETAGYTPSATLSSATGTVTGTASETWSYSITWHEDPYYGYDKSYGWQIGAKASGGKQRGCKAFSISTSGISGTITKIEVEAGSYNANSKIYVTVGGADFGTQGQATNSGQGATKSTFSGSASGEIIISASDAVRAFYLKSIVVTYTPAAAPTVDVTGVSLDKTSATIEMGETLTLVPTVSPADATNKNVTWTSSPTGVVTVANGVVTPVSVGSTTVTATTVDGGYTATCDVTVKAASTPIVTLDLTDTNWGFPDGYTTTEETYTNGGYTLTFGTSSNGHKKMGSPTQTGVLFGKEDATLSLPAFRFNVKKIKVSGISGASGKVTFNVFVGATAVSTEVTGSATDHVFQIAEAYQAAGNTYTIKLTNDNNCQISQIDVYGYLRIGEYQWATFVYNEPLDFKSSDMTAYVVAGHTGTALTLTEVTGTVNANTPLLINADEGDYDVPVSATGTAYGTNFLKAGTGVAVSQASGYDRYVLSVYNDKAAFKQITTNSATVPVGKAYLEFTSGTGAPSIIRIVDEESGATSVEEIESNDDMVKFIRNGQLLIKRDGVTYDVMGRVVK